MSHKLQLGLGLWCLMSLSTIFQQYRGGQFYWWGETGVPGENHWPAASHWQTLSYNVNIGGIQTHNVSGDR